MLPIRIIARLDVKGAKVIKSVNLEGLRVVGDPNEFSKDYYLQGADELLFMDPVASLYGRNSLLDIVSKTVDQVYVPITVGGGIRSLEDATSVFRSGADKVAVNTSAIKRPSLISELSEHFGSQSIVVSIEAKATEDKSFLAFTDNGRENSGRDVVEWAREAEFRGAGEILLTSIDKEGTHSGFDTELIASVNNAVRIPVVASGGMGRVEHLSTCYSKVKVSAFAIAAVLHYQISTIREIKQHCRNLNLDVRMV